MKKLNSAGFTELPGQLFTPENPECAAAEPLEVNVIFTGVKATATALRAAESFARELGARIRLRAGIVVPVQLPLDQPLVSIDFLERALWNLVNRSESDELEQSIHLYICRDWIDTLLEVLKPDSLAVMSFRKRLWPTAESRLARTLRSKGIRVIVVDQGQTPAANPPTRKMAAWLSARRVPAALSAVDSQEIREVD